LASAVVVVSRESLVVAELLLFGSYGSRSEPSPSCHLASFGLHGLSFS
jgi:hypothetical protein